MDKPKFFVIVLVIFLLIFLINCFLFISNPEYSYFGFTNVLDVMSNCPNAFDSFSGITTWLDNITVSSDVEVINNLLSILIVPVKLVVFVCTGIFQILVFLLYFLSTLFGI